MNSSSAVGIVLSIALFIPILLILALRLFTNKSFLALAIYYFVLFVGTLMKDNVVIVSKSVYQSLGIADNLLDAPLLLVFFMFFSTSSLMMRRIMLSIFGFLVFEIIILAIFGFGVTAVKIILGPDITVILVFSFMFFLRYVRLAITNSKSLGKAVMISSILLSYSIFSLVYIFYYLVKDNPGYREDARFIYYMVTIISALLMSIGIAIERKRIKKLDELKHTRKELATIYGETKVAALNKDSRFLSTESNQ